MRRVSLILSLLIGASTAASCATCESLTQFRLPNATITSVSSVGAGAFVAPTGAKTESFRGLPGFCRVTAILKPSSDSSIKIEVWLPATTWNGKLAGTGNGGYAGAVDPVALAEVVRRGYAAVSTDSGHSAENTDASFAWNHREKLIDFGYRATHEMTVAAKALTRAFYSNDPKLSYWVGCSTGGRQAMTEAQLYPEDYDGIVAGAPGNNTAQLTIQALAIGRASHRSDSSLIPSSLYPVIHKAVLAACDAQDGVKDGVLENPERCHFDPAVLACKSDEKTNCLTPAQIETVRTIYNPLRNVHTNDMPVLALQPGSELGWANMAGPEPFFYATEFWKYMVMNEPKWDYKTLDLDNALSLTKKLERERGDASDPNLKPFFSRRGKLLQYQGWSDQNIPPRNSIVYYQRVADTLGGVNAIDSDYRLFMVPGMGHCRGGEGTDKFDMLGSLEQWREQGKAPDRVVASRLDADGSLKRTRPLCPWPQVAVYKGTGSTDDAANFTCRAQ